MDGNTFSSPTPFTPPTTEEDRLSWLRLIRSRRVGAATFHRLLAEHGSAAAALDALPGIARAAGVDDYAPCPPDAARQEIEAGARKGARLVCLGDPDYPSALAALSDAPPVLWALGRKPDLLRRPALGIVGARNASSLGQRMARKLAEGLGFHGLTVVSGLARGIDTAAHGAALQSGTIAVMAGGVDIVYPPENAALAAAIADQGLRLSEQPIGLQPQARHFPRRNRLIAGLSWAVVVVEAAEGSGSLITARDALDQGREVLAVPGHPFDARAAGCNALIRDGARLVRDTADVIAALEGGLPGAPDRLPDAAPPSAIDVAAAATARTTPGKRAETPEADAEHPAAGHPADRPQPRPRQPRSPQSHGPQFHSQQSASASRDRPSPGATPPETTPPDTPTLHKHILDRLGAAPVAEDQLLRDLALPAAIVAPALLFLELDGRLHRQPGGMLSRV